MMLCRLAAPFSATLLIAILGITSPAALAAPSLILSTGADPTESTTTQILSGGMSANNSTSLSVTLKASGGQGCGANFTADDGEVVLSGHTVEETSFSASVNHEFPNAGSYLLCGWLNDNAQSGGPVVATASLTFTVRQPHLALSIAAPPSVPAGQVFQLVTTAQAEVERPVHEYLLPNTGRGCPANAAAAEASLNGQFVAYPFVFSWSVTGGPFSKSVNDTLTGAGQYLACAYVQYPSNQSPPEITASASITAVAPPPPCVVPSFTSATTSGAMQQAIRAGGCTVGTIRRAASRIVRAGHVIRLSSPSGKHLAAGTPVNVTISTGPPCIVPSVSAGTRLGTTERRLLSNHCAVGKISFTRSSRHRGRVLRLAAKVGQVLPSHAAIPIIVARGRRHH